MNEYNAPTASAGMPGATIQYTGDIRPMPETSAGMNRPPASVPTHLDVLASQVDRLGHQVVRLTERLDPVLAPTVPQPMSPHSDSMGEPQCIVAARLASYHDEIGRLADRIADLTYRLEV